jgi:hypothetical protein
MTDEPFPADRLDRILNAVETIEVSLGVLARKQSLSREEYHNDTDSQDIVERRFVKMTEAAIDIAEELVKHERGSPPESNPKSMRVLEELGILSASTATEMAQGGSVSQRPRTHLRRDHRARCRPQRLTGSRAVSAVSYRGPRLPRIRRRARGVICQQRSVPDHCCSGH